MKSNSNSKSWNCSVVASTPLRFGSPSCPPWITLLVTVQRAVPSWVQFVRSCPLNNGRHGAWTSAANAAEAARQTPAKPIKIRFMNVAATVAIRGPEENDFRRNKNGKGVERKWAIIRKDVATLWKQN